MPEFMWHPFKVGQGADSALKAAKNRFYKRVAKNHIVERDKGRLVMEWYFPQCTLVIRWDPEMLQYAISQINPPLVTGVKLSTSQAGMTAEEVGERVKILEYMEQLDG